MLKRIESNNCAARRLSLGCSLMLCVVLYVLAAANAKAQVLYTQPLLAGGSSYNSNIGGDQGFDGFNLPGGGSITRVEWYGSDFTGVTAFTVSFWSDIGGLPGAP